MSYGSTAIGFVRPSYDDILSQLETQARLPEYFGPDADLSPYSPLGLLLQIIARSESSTWEGMEGNYYASFVDTAVGVMLDRAVRLAGLTRKPVSYATVTLTFSGSNGSTVPVGTLVRTAAGIEYETTVEGVVADGTATVPARAMQWGFASAVIAGQLTQLATIPPGILTVTNEAASSGGGPAETDEELRLRFIEKVTLNTKDVGALTEIRILIESEEFIRSCKIEENTLNVEVDGMAPNSMLFVVDGGTDEEVAALIFRYKPGGIYLNGDIAVYVTDDYGNSHPVRFIRPETLQIYVNVSIQTKAGWVADNVRLVKTAMVKVIGGTDTYTIGGETFVDEYSGLRAGEDVLSLGLYTELAAIPGIQNATIALGTDSGDITYPSVDVLPTQIARCITANVTVTIL